MSEYTIREFQPADREPYLALFPEVMDLTHEPGWFTWKYRNNPYVDHVPIFVAEHEGDIVGVRSFFALEMCVEGTHHVALQPCDTMVQPDHRRQGLFTRMTKRAIQRYEHGRPAFFFNFPNPMTLQGNRKLGWELVGDRPTYYRIEDPATTVRSSTTSTGIQVASAVSTPLVRAYNRLREATASVPEEVTVSRTETMPTTRLAAAYRDRLPSEIHATRDDRFYEWRFGNPDWAYTTYITERDTGLQLAAVVGRSRYTEMQITKLTDVVPLPAQDRVPETLALLDAVVTDYPGTDLFVVPDGVLPSSALRAFGFSSDESPPLSYVGDRTYHVVRSLNGWNVEGRDIRDAANWAITFAEHDTS